MSDQLFRMVCVPAALDGWSQDLLRDGEVALLVDDGGLDAVSAVARAWAHDRGPMTLLVEATGALADEERRRITRFLSILGRQSE